MNTTVEAESAPMSDVENTVANSTAAAPEISVKALDKTFATDRAKVQALSQINVEVQRGEFLSLIGRSGCGKTTLLRTLAGLTAPTAGTIEIAGRPLWRGSRVDEKVITKLGVVFQEANLFPWNNIVDNIALPLKIRGISRAQRRERATELAELVGLGGFLKSYPRELSGGMRQRAAIARALSDRPQLLLMDEPFGALDALTREKMNIEIQRIAAATGATVVFVTHDIEEAVFLGDRVVHLTPRPGRIKEIVHVPLARERTIELHTSPEFNALVADLRASLNEEESDES